MGRTATGPEHRSIVSGPGRRRCRRAAPARGRRSRARVERPRRRLDVQIAHVAYSDWRPRRRFRLWPTLLPRGLLGAPSTALRAGVTDTGEARASGAPEYQRAFLARIA